MYPMTVFLILHLSDCHATNSFSPCQTCGWIQKLAWKQLKVVLVCPWPLWILIRLSALIAHQPGFSSDILKAPVSSCTFAVGRKEKPAFRNKVVAPLNNWRKRDNVSMYQKGEWRTGGEKKSETRRQRKRDREKNLPRGASKQTPYASSLIVPGNKQQIIW